MANKKAPELRFKGFTDDWEQRKLNELAHFSKGSGYTKNDLTESGSPIILYGRLYTNYQTVINNVDTFVEMKDKSVISVGNEVIVPSSGESSEDIARGSVVDAAGIILGGDLNVIKPKDEINSTFLALTISNGQQQRELSNRAQGKSIVHLHNSDLKEVNLIFPIINEQKQIGDFFKVFENTITLHQRKLKQLQVLKQAYLQQMFPSDTEKVPKLRFANFNKEWEQRKVTSMAKETYGGGTPKTSIKEYWQGNFPWIQSSDLKVDEVNHVTPTKFITQEAISNSATKAVPKNSIAIVTRVGVGKLAFMPISYATSQDFLSLSSLKVDPYFGVYSLYKLLQKEIKNIQGTSIKGMTKSDLLEKRIEIPTNMAEQASIGLFFKRLDSTITLHQHKLEQMQNLKQAYLQKMFI